MRLEKYFFFCIYTRHVSRSTLLKDVSKMRERERERGEDIKICKITSCRQSGSLRFSISKTTQKLVFFCRERNRRKKRRKKYFNLRKSIFMSYDSSFFIRVYPCICVHIFIFISFHSLFSFLTFLFDCIFYINIARVFRILLFWKGNSLQEYLFFAVASSK